MKNNPFRLSLLMILLVNLAAVGCSIAREPSAGSQTHFLRACSATCAAPYSCLCGVCSLVCDDSAQCTEHAPGADCIAAADGSSCDDAPRMCDVECQKDAECNSMFGAGYRCEAGRCRGSAVTAPPDTMSPPKNTPDAGSKTVDAGSTTVDAATNPNNPGTSPDAGTPCRGLPVDKLDLLFMIDNSNSMSEEQEALKVQFPKLMRVLTSGQRFDGDRNPFPAIKDLHVGVVSSDMGIAGIEFASCHADGGDDGRLQNRPHGEGCDAAYPSFLSYSTEQGADLMKFANDFGCIAALGTGGCGFEQQLEAPLKALWPSVFSDANGNVVSPNPIQFLSTTAQGTLGRGDLPAAQGGNAGFLRNDPTTGLSMVAIVVVTDEEDCSPRTTEFLRPKEQYPMDSPYFGQDLNLRCFYNPSLLFDVTNRYLKGFQLLRQGYEDMVMFAGIVGVPVNLVSSDALDAVDFSDATSRDKFYDDILNDTRMQQVVDPSSNPGQGAGNLKPSCTRIDANGHVATAYPPRRIVQLAKGFGENGIVQSICQDDFEPAIDTIINLMAKRLGNASSCVRGPVAAVPKGGENPMP